MIRKAGYHDFDFLYSLYMAPGINPFLLYEPMDKEAFRPVMKELLDKGVLYIFLQEGKPAGMFKLVPQQYRNSHIIYLGGLAIAPDFSGRGLGKVMLEEIISFANQNRFKRIELSVAAINEKAIHLYESMGFQREGVLKNFTFLASKNKFLDEILMAYLF